MRRHIISRAVRPLMLTLLTAGVACSQPKTPADAPAQTQRQRDSVIGASSLPGAAGVRGAMSASDSAAARKARLDSIASDTTSF